jgi:hypothetical protein
MTSLHTSDGDAADLILRPLKCSSTDPGTDAEQTDFRVRKVDLATSSPLFKQAFENPESISSFPRNLNRLPLWERLDEGGIPILVLPEDSQTIRHLLSAVCPNPSSPTFDSLETVARLIAKAKAYQMNSAETHFRQLYIQMTTIPSSFKSYSIACVFDLEQEAQLAAQLTLSLPMTPDSCINNLQTATITDIRDLATYRSACHSAIRVKLSKYDEIPGLKDLWIGEGTPGTSVCHERNGIFPTWFCDYVTSLSDRDPILIEMEEIQGLMNRHASSAEDYERPDSESKECQCCRFFPVHHLQRARDILQSLLKEVVEPIVSVYCFTSILSTNVPGL